MGPERGDDRLQLQRDHEHAQRVVEVGEREHGGGRAAVGARAQPGGHIERRAGAPRGERVRRHHVVQVERQRGARLGRDDLVGREQADAVDARLDDGREQRFERHVFARGEGRAAPHSPPMVHLWCAFPLRTDGDPGSAFWTMRPTMEQMPSYDCSPK